MTIRRRRHVSFGGAAAIVVTILLGLGAINSQNNMLFYVFGLALAGMLASGIVGGTMLVAVKAERRAPATGAVGQPLHLSWTVSNRSRVLPAFALSLTEIPVKRGRAGGGATAWQTHVPPAQAFVVHVPPRREAHVDAVVTPLRRGMVAFGGYRVTTTFPFGVSRKSIEHRPGSNQRCLIRPETRAVRPGLLRSLTAASVHGESPATTVGPGDEFFGLREYVPGDSARRIAWRPSARSGNLVVRETLAMTPARVWVALILSPGTDEASRREDERAISLAASLVHQARLENVEVGLCVPAAGVEIPPRVGPRHTSALLDTLAALDVDAEGVDRRRLGLARGRAAQKSGWILVSAGDGSAHGAPPGSLRLSSRRPFEALTPFERGESPTWG